MIRKARALSKNMDSFLVSSLNSYAQSLPDTTALRDTTLIQALIDSSYENSYSDPNRAIEFANEALKLSNEIDFKKGTAGAHRELGHAFTTKGKFQKALKHYNEALRHANESLGRSVRNPMMGEGSGGGHSHEGESSNSYEEGSH